MAPELDVLWAMGIGILIMLKIAYLKEHLRRRKLLLGKSQNLMNGNGQTQFVELLERFGCGSVSAIFRNPTRL